MAGYSYRKLNSTSSVYAKAYPEHARKASHYMVTVEPSTVGMRHETMSDCQDTVMAAEHMGRAYHVEVIFMDGSSLAVAL